MRKKWKTALFSSIVVLAFVGIILTFYLITLFTPNLNVKVSFISNGALGTVDSRIANASNGSPTSLFNFDYTETEPQTLDWVAKNMLFKGDNETITLEFNVHNMAHFVTVANFSFESPHKNANVLTMFNNVQTNISNVVLMPYSENKVSIIIGKQNPKSPIRANLNLTLTLTPQV